MASGGAHLHYKARQLEYQNGAAKRFPVPDDKVSWSVEWPEYAPVDYTAPSILRGPVWADPDIRYACKDADGNMTCPIQLNTLD